jgi:uncharacterized protein (DUF2252 family)
MALSDVDSRRRAARALREQVPRSSHALWQPPASRRDPASILGEQERNRVQDLLPIRHERMSVSPFAFLRGAAAVMAEDLAGTPASGLRVQACGDAHLLNFGIYATPERQLVFDVNDFDETLPAPFEWDLKRLAASVVVAGRVQGFSPQSLESAARSAATAYRARMLESAAMSHVEVWYARLDVGDLTGLLDKVQRRRLASGPLRKAQRSTSLGALDKLTAAVDSELRIVDAPPLIEHLSDPQSAIDVPDVMRRYRASLPGERRVLLDRYRLVDWARKVVGVGSVGTDDVVALLLGDSPRHALFLQVKEAQGSVLEPFAGRSRFANQGQRVVIGQRLTQSASDIFLGWTHVGARDYYVRQLRDMKASVSIEKLLADELAEYASACATALAQGHARSGDPTAIAAYLGSGDAFDRAIGEFAVAYADQTERDYAAYVAVVEPGGGGRAPGAKSPPRDDRAAEEDGPPAS